MSSDLIKDITQLLEDTSYKKYIMSSPKRPAFPRSLSVPNSITPLPLLSPAETLVKKVEESIPSVTISDFSSAESSQLGQARFYTLPKRRGVTSCCGQHGLNTVSLSPAQSMNSLIDNESFLDAEPETP